MIPLFAIPLFIALCAYAWGRTAFQQANECHREREAERLHFIDSKTALALGLGMGVVQHGQVNYTSGSAE